MSNKSFAATVFILLSVLAAVGLFGFRPVPQVVRTNLENLPMMIGGFRGVEDSFSDAVYAELNADKHLYRHYVDTEGNQVSLYVGYYGTAKGGRTPHNPYACLPSAGWAILESRQVEIASSSDVESYKVNYILAKNDEVFETVLHWYQSDQDKVLVSGLQQNVQRFLGRVIHNRNDGAFVRVTASIGENQIDEARKRIAGFTEMIIPLLAENWPEEQ